MDHAEGDGLYVAGHTAPPGRYRRVDAPDPRTLVLEREDILPGSCDGRVALYERVMTPPRVLRSDESKRPRYRHKTA